MYKKTKKPVENVNIAPEVIEPILTKYALTDSKYLDLLAQYFEADWFDDVNLGKIIVTACRYRQKFNRIPTPDTMKLSLTYLFKDDELEDCKIKLDNVYSLTTDFDSDYIDEQIVNYLKFRGMYHLVISNIDDFKKVNKIEEYISTLQKLSGMTFDADLGHMYIKDAQKHVDYLKNPEAAISTGYPSLNSLLNGGFPRDGKSLIIFVAQVHMGKSAFISNIAAKMLRQNMFPMIISLEMSEQVYAKRISAHLTGNNINLLSYNTESIEQTIQRIKTEHPQGELIIKEFAPSSINCNHLKTYIDKVISSVNRIPDAIFVDYLGLLNPSNGIKADDLYLKGGSVAKALRALSYYYKRPVITAQQLNRSGFDSNDAGLDNISESYSIGADADAVFHLYQQEGDKEAEKINLRVIKNRIGGRVGCRKEFFFSNTSLALEDIESIGNSQTTERIVDSIVEQTDIKDI